MSLATITPSPARPTAAAVPVNPAPKFHPTVLAIDPKDAIPFRFNMLVHSPSIKLQASSLADAIAATRQLATSGKQMHTVAQDDNSTWWAVPNMVTFGVGWPGSTPSTPVPAQVANLNGTLRGVDRNIDPHVKALVTDTGDVFDISAGGKFPLEPPVTRDMRGDLLGMINVQTGAKAVSWKVSSAPFGFVDTHFRPLGSTLAEAERTAQALARLPHAFYITGSVGILKGQDGKFYGTALNDVDLDFRRLNIDIPAGNQQAWDKLTVTRATPLLQAIVGEKHILRFGDGDTAVLIPDARKK